MIQFRCVCGMSLEANPGLAGAEVGCVCGRSVAVPIALDEVPPGPLAGESPGADFDTGWYVKGSIGGRVVRSALEPGTAHVEGHAATSKGQD